MVDRRDQVRRTFLSLIWFIPTIFFIRWSSMKGPFFAERDIVLSSDFLCCDAGYDESLACETWCCWKTKNKKPVTNTLSLLTTPLDDEDIRPLVVAGLISAGWLTPRSDRVASARGLTFTTTVRVIDRVHRNTAVRGANTLPATTAGLADGDIFVVSVADLT